MFYFGICESREDPLKLGRLQVRVFGVHTEDKGLLPTKDLPWASVLMPTTGPSLSEFGNSTPFIIEGATVIVSFMDGEAKQLPMVIGSIHGIPQKKKPLEDPFSAGASDINIQSDSTVAEDTIKQQEEETPPPEPPSSDEQTGYPTKAQIEDLKKALRARESSGNYSAVNSIGFSGAYQFGAPRLEDLGVIKPGKSKDFDPKPNNALNDSNSYTGKLGIDSKSEFLKDEKAQDQLIEESFKLSFSRLKRQGIVNDSSPTKEIAGYLFASHLVGEGGARDLKNGIIKSDANGVKSKAYYDLGFATITGENPTEEDMVAMSKPTTGRTINSRTSISGSGGGPTGQIVGFKDPNEVYPLDDRLKEPDTHRLARRFTEDTPVAQKIKQRTTGIRSIGGSFDQLEAPYNSEYPYNHVFYSEGGHLMEFDDTPEAERVNLFHTTGSFIEFDKFGNRTSKIVGDDYTIVDRNGYIFITGTARATVSGNVKIVVEGNAEIEVDGDMTTDVGGDYTLRVGGNYFLQTRGVNSQRSESGNASIDAPRVFFNSGVSASIGTNPRGSSGYDFPPQIPESIKGDNFFLIDEEDPNTVGAFYDNAINGGLVTEEQLQEGKDKVSGDATELDETKPPKFPMKDPDCKDFEQYTTIPSNLKISKYYTIGQLSDRQVVAKTKLSPNQGLSEKDIACNLKELATNVLDKIKQKYPSALVTNAFRKTGTQHGRGQAADIQFPGIPNSQYFEIAKWIRDNVPVDQLLLEYKTTGTKTPWIHVSYNKNGNRGDIKTFMNHASVGNGLKNLG